MACVGALRPYRAPAPLTLVVRLYMLIPLHDPRWQDFKGGYGVAYDPSKALDALEKGEDSWGELWENLHHQGDVGVASYATVPHIARIVSHGWAKSWHPYGLVATIEIERHRKSNPDIPEWLNDTYTQAIQNLARSGASELLSTTDPLLVQCIIGLLALSRSHVKLGALICNLDQSEIDDAAEDRLAWSSQYK